MANSRTSGASVERWLSDAASLPTLQRTALDDCYVLFLHLQMLEPDASGSPAGSGPDTQVPGSIFVQDSSQKELPALIAPFDCLVFHLPKAGFRQAAAQLGAAPAERFRCSLREPTVDLVVYALGRSLLPALNQAARGSSELEEHVLRAITVHVFQMYGEAAEAVDSAAVFGLSSQQLDLAKRLLDDPAQRRTVREVAAACSVSASHFSRSFLRATGLTPHRFQMQCRVERAKGLLRSSSSSLTEIAAACGFADHSHFSRVFRSIVGATPASFRDAFNKPRA